jgi:hypothetical protein
MKKFAGLSVAWGVVVAVLIALAVAPPAMADPDPVPAGNTCICHAVEQNKAEAGAEGAPNKYVLICPNNSSKSENKNLMGHASHPDDVQIIVDPETPPVCPEPPSEGEG